MGFSQSKVSTERAIGGTTKFQSDRSCNENMYQYIDRVVQPDTDYLKTCNRIVDKVVMFLHDNLQRSFKQYEPHGRLNGVSLQEILKSGSLGKSTAVKNKSDIDLILFLNGIETVERLKELNPLILECLRKLLDHLVRDPNHDWARSIRYKTPTPFAVSFYLKVSHNGQVDEREIDLLPAVNITRPGGTHLTSVENPLPGIYRHMDSIDEDLRRNYSACLSRVQRDFVQKKTAPPKVKNLIRLMKNWAKDFDVPIRSYFIELLVIYNQLEYQDHDFKIEIHAKQILERLCQCDRMKIAFNDHYDFRHYRNAATKEVPYLLDPANPFMNTAPSPREAAIVAQMAKDALSCFTQM